MQYNQNLVRFLVGEVWRRKLWFILAAVVGATLATLAVYLKPPRYEARATFVADLSVLARQVEFLESRDLFRQAMGKLDHVKIRCYSKALFGRESDFYDRSPVSIIVNRFPDHLRNVEMKLDFSEGDAFGLSFRALGEKVVAQGKFGGILQLGGIEMVIEPTIYWADRWAGQSIWFQVHSLDQVVGKAVADYRVENVNHRKNRIALYYTDDNSQRALDILRSLCREALAGHQRQVEFQMASRVKRIETKMDLLLRQLAGDGWLEELLNGEHLAGPNDEIDSLVIGLQTLAMEKGKFRMRDSLLWEIKSTGFAGKDFEAAFRKYRTSALDSVLFDLLQRRDDNRRDSSSNPGLLRELNVKVQNVVTSILREDSLSKLNLESRIAQMEDYLMINVNLRNAFVRNSIQGRRGVDRGVLIWEEYLSNAQNKYQMEFELVKNAGQFDLIESPYVRNPKRRFVQVRRILTGGMLGMLLVFAIMLLSTFGLGRIRSKEHLQVVNPVKFAALIQEDNAEKAVRSIHVALEMDRKASEKIVSVMNPQNLPEWNRLVDQLADRFRATGRKVAVYRDQVAGEVADAPAQDLAIRLLSKMREEELGTLSLGHDLVIQHLPSFREFPEAWYPASAQRVVIYLVRRHDMLQGELRDLEERMEKSGFRVYLYIAPA